MPSGPLEAGIRFGDFQIVSTIGAGGMGVVYLADDTRLGRKVALKVISPQLAHDAEFRERFEAEARSAAAIDHPNVVPVYSAGVDAERFFIAMRYVDGVDLRTRLRDSGPLDLAVAVEVAAAVAAGLDAAHEAGLVHRDVKPANILLPSGRAPVAAYLTDFGLTKGLQEGSAQLTGTGQWLGTVDYVAPEQITSGVVDARTDVYALGCVLFEAISGAPPFAGTEMQRMWHQVHEPLPALPASGLAQRLDPVIARATAKDPDERFASAGDLARGAQTALTGRPAELSEHSVARGAAAIGLTGEGDRQRTRTMRSPNPRAREAETTRMPVAVQVPAGEQRQRRGGFSARLAAVIGACIVLAAGLLAAALIVAGDDEPSARTVVNRPVETVTSEVSSGEDTAPGAGRPTEGMGAGVPASDVDSAAFETYAQTFYNVDIPNGWELEEDDVFNGTFYQSTWHPPGDPDTTILIDAQTPAPSVSPVVSAEIVREEASQSDGYVEHSFEETVLAGLPAARWVFEIDGVRKVDYFLNYCNAGIAVLGSTVPAAFGGLVPTFHEVASSVRSYCGE